MVPGQAGPSSSFVHLIIEVQRLHLIWLGIYSPVFILCYAFLSIKFLFVCSSLLFAIQNWHVCTADTFFQEEVNHCVCFTPHPPRVFRYVTQLNVVVVQINKGVKTQISTETHVDNSKRVRCHSSEKF